MVKQEAQVSDIIIAYEFALGLIESLLGLGIIFLGRPLLRIYAGLRNSNFLGEQHDLLVGVLEKTIPYLFAHRFYIAILLLALGSVKIVAGIGLWMGKIWGKHLLVWLLVILIPFDLAGMIRHFSFLDLLYLFLDVLIILYMIGFDPKGYLKEFKKSFS